MKSSRGRGLGEVGHIDIRRNRVSGRGNSQCQGPGVGAYLEYSGNGKEARVAREEWAVGRVRGEVRKGGDANCLRAS